MKTQREYLDANDKKFKMTTTYSLLFIFFLFGLINFFFLDDAIALLENFSIFKIVILSTVFVAFVIGYFITIAATYIGKKIDQMTDIIRETINYLR